MRELAGLPSWPRPCCTAPLRRERHGDHQHQDEKDSARLLSHFVEAQGLAHVGSWDRNLITEAVTGA
jgi:hypothetical protein